MNADARQLTDGRLEGLILERETARPIPSATVFLVETDRGTVTGPSGAFVLDLSPGMHRFSVSAIGYETVSDSVFVESGQTVHRVIHLRERPVEMNEIVVPADAPEVRAGRYDIDPRAVASNPAPLSDGLRILKTLPGVTTNTELSSGYSVRGGNTNENQVLIQGFEILRPLRIRRGEQEGLSPVNPLLLRKMTFLTSGLPAEFGGKLSSTLEIDYFSESGRTHRLNAYGSLLDAGIAYRGRIGSQGDRWVASIRSSHPGRFFATQETKGVYNPLYLDAQAAVRMPLGRRHRLEAIGIATMQSYRLRPLTRTAVSASGGPTSVTVESTRYSYNGQERSGYRTILAGVRLETVLSPRVASQHAAQFYGTAEYDESVVTAIASMSSFTVNPSTGEQGEPQFRGRFSQRTSIDNSVAARYGMLQGRYSLTTRSSAFEAGWTTRLLHASDDVYEFEALSSLTRDTTATPDDPGDIPVTDSTNARQVEGRSVWTLPSVGGFVQRTGGIPGVGDNVIVYSGARLDWNLYSDELTVSPRVRIDVGFGRTRWSLAWGVYHQAPGYAEYRGDPEPGETSLSDPGRDLLSQRATSYSIGVDREIGGGTWRYRAEGFYRRMTRLVSYTVEDTRVVYSGDNDSDGFAWGFDLHLGGQPVPGLDSWFSYSFLVARERFREPGSVAQQSGYIPRPADQRHTLSWFVQDRFRGRDDVFVNLRLLMGSGYPYTRPALNQVDPLPSVRENEERNAARYAAFFRVDIGTTVELIGAGDLQGRWSDAVLALDAELLNMFDAVNTIDYTWVVNDDGEYEGIPRKLTPRTFNLRLSLRF